MFIENNSTDPSNPFKSFWMAGYECSDKLNCFGNRVDLLSLTGHIDRIDEDYALLRRFDIRTVREGIRWSKVEYKPYQYDWRDVRVMIRAAKRHDIQIVWDVCHFGFPDDLSPLHPVFARRFAAICRAFTLLMVEEMPGEPFIVTPINEVSFLSWLGGEVGGTSPFCKRYGWETKYCLMKAYIEGIEAIKAVNPDARIMTTEPLVNLVPPADADITQILAAAELHEQQFQVLDILSGRACPELRGRPEYVDIIGCNFYFNNQWIVPTFEFLPWANEQNDPRWRPLSELFAEVIARYNRPLVLSETSHPGQDRPEWTRFITDQALLTLEQGLPFWGICWYPIIDRPDWDFPEREWHHSGIWDIPGGSVQQLDRTLDENIAGALLDAQAQIDRHFSASAITASTR